jgi:hypothetical protein
MYTGPGKFLWQYARRCCITTAHIFYMPALANIALSQFSIGTLRTPGTLGILHELYGGVV